MSDWASSSIIEDVELIRQMFYLLYRQYGALDEVSGSSENTTTNENLIFETNFLFIVYDSLDRD